MSSVLNMREKIWRQASDRLDDARRAYLASVMLPQKLRDELWDSVIVLKREEAVAFREYTVTREFVEADQARANAVFSLSNN